MKWSKDGQGCDSHLLMKELSYESNSKMFNINLFVDTLARKSRAVAIVSRPESFALLALAAVTHAAPVTVVGTAELVAVAKLATKPTDTINCTQGV